MHKGPAPLSDPVFVQIMKVAAMRPGAAPIDITAKVKAVDPNAVPRILSRIEVHKTDSVEPAPSPRFFSIAKACTHEGCDLLKGSPEWTTSTRPIVFSMFGANGIDYAVIECPCHGSRFDLTNGDRLLGPAAQNLARFETKIEKADGEDWVFVALAPAA
jgi:Rieske Fe-S protein